MTKHLFVFFLCLTSMSLSAQSPAYVDFEWDILRFGYVIPFGSNQEAGLSFGGELRYNATDNFSIGLSGQAAAFGTDFGDNADLGVAFSSMMTGDYYLRNDSGTRAFFGAGLGISTSGEIEIRNGNVSEVIDGTTGFVMAPRAGYEFGHVRLQGQYNLTAKEGHDDFFELTVALTLWGGYKGDQQGQK